jgi:glycosyltransferase involved in cell wall biosynthesis
MQNGTGLIDTIPSRHGSRLQEGPALNAVYACHPQTSSSKVAVVHDWFPSFRGGERVVAEISQMYRSRIFTIFDFLDECTKKDHFPSIEFEASIANNLPLVKHYYRALFFACPFLIEQLDVTNYDFVISSSAAYARGVITRPDQPHVCYVHSPARYAWDEQFAYLQSAGLGYGPKGLLFRYFLHKLRTWDIRTAHNPDLMIANSTYVKKRIRRIYGRDATIVYPPVTISEFPFVQQKDDYYVTASFLAPYKRTDLVIEAFNEMPNKRLIVVGGGQQSRKLRDLAGPNVSFTGFLPRAAYVKAIAEAQALVFAGCEDFGIALAEAQVAGTPIIAFYRGGASDIVQPLDSAERPTGVLFAQQTAEAIKQAVAHFEDRKHLISPSACHMNALRFSPDRFRYEFAAAVCKVVEMHR